MAITEEILAQLDCRFAVVLPHLNERQRRVAVAAEARLLGHGGVRAAARVAGMSETTVRRGVAELEAGLDPLPDGRVRARGGGRKPIEETDPAVLKALLAMVEPDERGDPESPLRWTTRSLRHLTEELTRHRPLQKGRFQVAHGLGESAGASGDGSGAGLWRWRAAGGGGSYTVTSPRGLVKASRKALALCWP
jgi:Rhodopirellula transposase DDE domain